MRARKKGIKSNLNKVDRHIITPGEYDELPEITEENFARATYAVGGRILPHPRRGRPKASVTKRQTTLRLSPEVVDYFRAQGRGWQTQIDDVLKKWIAKHPRRAA